MFLLVAVAFVVSVAYLVDELWGPFWEPYSSGPEYVTIHWRIIYVKPDKPWFPWLK